MSEYRNIENSVYGAKPIECYYFASAYNTWKYTSADQDVSIGGNTYTAIAIQRNEIQQTEEIHKAGIELSLPKTNALALQVFLNTSDEIITLTIYRFHYGSTDYVAYWKGRILGAKKQSPKADIVLNCESIFSSLRRIGIRQTFNILCPVHIYSTRCGLDKDNWATAGTVAGIDSTKIILTVTEASAQEDNYYTGGMAKFGSSPITWRHIMSHTGSTIKISRPVYGLAETDAINIYPGCDRNIDTCISKFDNLPNFRGCPWIPDRNPFDGKSIV